MTRVLVLNEGTPVFSGTYEELQKSRDVTLRHYLISSKMGEEHNDEKNTTEGYEGIANEKEQVIMTAEERQFGLSKCSTWLTWLKYAGGWTFISLQILFLIIDRFLYVCSEWWIAKWSEASDESIKAFGREFPPQTDGRSAQIQYVAVYFGILAVSIAATSVRSHWGGEKSRVLSRWLE
jgi:hypothetical protein